MFTMRRHSRASIGGLLLLAVVTVLASHADKLALVSFMAHML